MSRYIDADIEITVNSYDAEYEEIKIRSDTIANFLDEFSDEGCPEFVDAIPVIRCNDCKYYGSRRWCELHSTTFDDTAFCSYGERNE